MAALLQEMSEVEQAAFGLLMHRLSGKELSDEEYLSAEFPDVDPAQVKCILKKYAEFKLHQNR